MTFGGEHDRTLASMWALAVILRFEEAEILFRSIVEIRGKNLGADHPMVIGSMFGLADILDYSGKSKEAEELYIKVIPNRERREGLDYNTLAAMYNLVQVVKRQGRYCWSHRG